MIPVSLRICNFLSYGKDVPPLDFTQFNIACLSGGNGQGKSALLDALTWVLWGEGRKAQQEKKADKGLLKIGEQQMWVDLVVELEGEQYRIIRKFSLLKNRSYSELELMVFDSQKNDYISLSAPSLRQTQQRINSILRMDYHTFINSAFILQGRVDEFTRKSARERKEILSEVLGLSRYEALSLLARKHIRELDKEIILLISRIEQIKKEVAQKDAVLEEIRSIEQDEHRQMSVTKAKKEILQKLEKEYHKLHYDQQQKEEIAIRISTEQRELQEFEKRREKIERQIKEYQFLLSQESNILSDYEIYLTLSQQSREMLQTMQYCRQLEEEKREIENRIKNIKTRLLLQLEQKQEKYTELSAKVSSLTTIKQEIKELELKIRYFTNLQKRKEQIEQEGNFIKVEIENKKSQIMRLQEDITNNQEKLDLLNKGDRHTCPLCFSPLDEKKKERITITIKQEMEKINLKIRDINNDITTLSNRKFSFQQEWKRLHDELKKKDMVQERLATCNLLVQEGEKISQQIKELTKSIKELQAKINQQDFAQEEKERLSDLEKRIKEQNYSDKRYLEINQKLDSLKEIPLQREKLQEAKKLFLKLEEEKRLMNKQYKDKEKSINKLKESQELLNKNGAKISDLQKKIAIEQEDLDKLLKELDELLVKKGASRERLGKINQYQQEQKEIEESIKRLSYQKDIYDKLNTAFGKNGIPSMIIENAIPELEEEANIILARLSDEPTRITLESLRELQSGEAKETLDIKIHDEMGIRPYELYSGGEAFRIDFALRIALSKLLTYRAGARLRTLVIDEGFGTQDEEGLQKLIQAINTIQSDFDKILVITHLPMLKDAFPVRIEVWKDPVLGSQFQMIHL